MYLALLNRNQAAALLGLARELMASDGNTSQEEEELYESFIREMDAYHVNHRMFVGRAAKLQHFSTRRDRIIALMALCQMAYADGTFSVDEIRYVGQLAQDFGLDEATRDACENWALELMELYRRAPSLWTASAEPSAAPSTLTRERLDEEE